MSNASLLCVNILILKLLNLWPLENAPTAGSWRKLKDFFGIFFIIPSFISFLVGLFHDALDENRDLSAITEVLIAIMVFTALFYVIICFVLNRGEIMKLVDKLGDFKKFGTPPDLLRVDKQISWFTICFMAYSVMGTLVYVSVPFMTVNQCEIKRSQYMKDLGIPCGLTLNNQPLPFKYDYAPRKQFIIIYQIMICTTCTTIISALTLLLCGMLSHITTQLRFLGSLLENLRNIPEAKIEGVLYKYVQFHIEIILFANKMNKAFSSMMFLHITVTSLLISTLGYQILVSDSYTYSVRYGLHLGGWLVLLFLICYNGQRLINESTAISNNAYFGQWIKYPVSIQKDLVLIITRAQRPLTLSAWNFGIMSLPTYLQVMSSAYSYFMLLLKLKSYS